VPWSIWSTSPAKATRGRPFSSSTAPPIRCGKRRAKPERHRLAYEAAPDFAAEHLPRIVHTAHQGENLAILSTIAGRGLEFALPWSACDHERQVNVVRQLSRSLLEDWNRGAKLAPGLQSPQTVLRGWLGYRLDPAQGRLHRFLPDSCGLPAGELSLSFEGQWYPNPLAFACAAPELVDRLKLRAVLGNVHGDLHGLNVLVSTAGTTKDHHYLIDLAFYEDKQFLFYDRAYFALSYLLALRGQATGSHWQSILNELCPFDHIKVQGHLRGEDIGLLALLRQLRQEVMDWVDRHQANRLSYMESQFQLAQVAVGLNFASKRIGDRERRLAFLYAAAILRDYLILHGVDWPKHGPLFTLNGQSPLSGGGGRRLEAMPNRRLPPSINIPLCRKSRPSPCSPSRTAAATPRRSSLPTASRTKSSWSCRGSTG